MDTDYIRGLAEELAKVKNLPELAQLVDKLHREYQRSVKAERADRTQGLFSQNKGKLVDEVSLGRETYRLEYVKCGKPDCSCRSGQGHGPYWYAYWSSKGKTKSRYVGKKLPEHVQAAKAITSGQVGTKVLPEHYTTLETALAIADRARESAEAAGTCVDAPE